jgi:hypothetical protein
MQIHTGEPGGRHRSILVSLSGITSTGKLSLPAGKICPAKPQQSIASTVSSQNFDRLLALSVNMHETLFVSSVMFPTRTGVGGKAHQSASANFCGDLGT